MEAITIEKLKMLEAKHGSKPAPKKRRLKVFYGWARLGKVRKRESISIIFENEECAAYKEGWLAAWQLSVDILAKMMRETKDLTDEHGYKIDLRELQAMFE